MLVNVNLQSVWWEAGRARKNLANNWTLIKELAQYKVVNWFRKEYPIAKIRSVMRITLCKYGYPGSVRNDAINVVVSMLVAGNKGQQDDGVL